MSQLQDTAGTIDKISAFLEKPVSEEDKKAIITHCSFEKMRENPMTNHWWFEYLGVADRNQGTFMRKGDYINVFYR